MSYIFTSESVSGGHPDKVCDQVSDAILDAYLAEDPNSRVACETMIKNNMVYIAGEITSSGNPDLEPIVRKTINDIGYNNDELGFNGDTCEFTNLVFQQSPDIAQGVNDGEGEDLEQGAGDQGLMFGYACKETDSLMPLPIDLSHRLVKKQADVMKSGELEWLRPDAKSQVTMQYKDGIPERIDTIVLSTQHAPEISLKDLREAVIEEIIKPVLPKGLIKGEINYLINPTGRFVIGGPQGDCGLTGRKIIVDTYGGAAPHGGGAFSGKDPSKVDRSAAYASRYLAKNIVAANLADECTIQLSYAIGVSKPLSVYVNTNGTNKVDEQKIEKSVQDLFDLSPRGIREHLKLTNAIYVPTSAYGHFGREPTDQGHFTWEKTDLVDSLKSLL